VTQYTRDEVEEILRRALETQPLETLSHEDLVASAIEAGIDADDVEAAARQIEEERELLAEEERILTKRKRSFMQSIYTYVIVNSGLDIVYGYSGQSMQNKGFFKCAGRNWGNEFAYVTGGGATFRE